MDAPELAEALTIMDDDIDGIFHFYRFTYHILWHLDWILVSADEERKLEEELKLQQE